MSGPNPAMIASGMLAKWYNSKKVKPRAAGGQGGQDGPKPTTPPVKPTSPTSSTPRKKPAKEATIKDTRAAIKAGKITAEEGVRVSKGYAQQVAKKKLAAEAKAKSAPVKKTAPAKKTVSPKKTTQPKVKPKK